MKGLVEVVRANRCWENVFALLLVSLSAVASFFVALTALKWSGLLSADVASWVQAIGSVLALIGAVWISDRSYRRSQEDRRRDLLSKEMRAINRVEAGMDALLVRIEAMKGALERRHEVATRDAIEAVDSCHAMLKIALDGLDEAGAVWARGHLVLPEIPRSAEKARKLQHAMNHAFSHPNYELVMAQADFRLHLAKFYASANAVKGACKAFIDNPSFASAD